MTTWVIIIISILLFTESISCGYFVSKKRGNISPTDHYSHLPPHFLNEEQFDSHIAGQSLHSITIRSGMLLNEKCNLAVCRNKVFAQMTVVMCTHGTSFEFGANCPKLIAVP